MVWATMDVLLCTASIWHMCTMSLDRYCTLRYPISYGRSRTKTSVRLKIGFVWVVSTAVCAALAVAGFADYSNVYVDGQCVPAVKHFILYGSILAFYVPLVIMVVTYVLTVRILAENRRTMASLELHTSVGRKTTANSDWTTGRLDGTAASKIGGSAVRQVDGPPTGRYRRKSTSIGGGGGAVAHRSTLGPDVAKPRRTRTDEESDVTSSVSALRPTDRHWTEPDLTSASHGAAAISDLSRSCPLGINRCRCSQSQPTTSNLSRPPSTSIPTAKLAPQPAADQEDDVRQLCLVTLFSSLEGRSPPLNDLPEQARTMFVCHQCFESLLHCDAAPVCSSEPVSTNDSKLRVCENINDRQRRLSEAALLDYRKISVRDQKRSSEVDLGSSWSLLRRRGQRPSCGELHDTTKDADIVPPSSKNRRPSATRARHSARSFEVDAVVCRADPLTNRLRTHDISDEESTQVAAGSGEIDRFRTQSQNRQPKPQRKDCRQSSVESGSANKSTATDCDLLASFSTSRPTRTVHAGAERDSYSVEPNWTRGGEATTVRKARSDRAGAARWLAWLQPPPATDTSASLSSATGSMSDAANHFQMSTFRRSRSSIAASISTLQSLGTGGSASKYRRTIATKERKASKVLGIIFAVFVLLWTPFFVVNVLSVACDRCLEALGSTGMSSLVWLGYVSSLANPVVYTMFSTSFRTVFYRILTCRACHLRRGVQSGVSYRLSRQVTLGDAMASARQPPAELTGLIGRGVAAAASQRPTGT